MPETAATAEDFIASCSFCGKPNTAVERLVAGPGVYICNECVGLCAEIVAETPRSTPEESAQRRSQYRSPSTEYILKVLPDLVRTADRIESELTRWIGLLRERGTDWRTIAGAAGVSIDATRQRFEAAPAE